MEGKIEIITGCMFSGKSTELLHRLQTSSKNFLLIKPKLDTRYDKRNVITHSGKKESAIIVNSVSEIFEKLQGIKILGIDEAQFFSPRIVKDCLTIKKLGLRIIIAGLNKDYLNKKFKSVDGLIKIADSTTKLYAVCSKCSSPANRSHRITNQRSKILLGHKNFYEPLCEKCYENAR